MSKVVIDVCAVVHNHKSAPNLTTSLTRYLVPGVEGTTSAAQSPLNSVPARTVNQFAISTSNPESTSDDVCPNVQRYTIPLYLTISLILYRVVIVQSPLHFSAKLTISQLLNDKSGSMPSSKSAAEV